MRRMQIAGALLVFWSIAVAIWFARPELPDAALFGAEVALAPELPPLVAPGGELALRGRLHTAAGAPAADAFVALVRPEDDPTEAEPVHHAYTDADGRFELRRLSPGEYRVVLTHPSAPPRTFALELSATGLAEEVSWELAAPLPPLPALPDLVRTALAGRIRFPETPAGGAPGLQGFEVVLQPAADAPILVGASARRATTDEQGRFTFADVVATSYRVEVLPSWARGGSWPVLARGTCVVGTDGTANMELVLAVGALEGELQETEGRPLVGALVKVTALGAMDPVGAPQQWPPAVTDAAGRFRVELLPAGRYLVHVRAGAAARDVEVVVEDGTVARVHVEPLDTRGAAPPPGG